MNPYAKRKQSMHQKNYIGDRVSLRIDDPNLDFVGAKDAAKKTAKELCPDPMLLSWYQGKTGEGYPNYECGSRDEPAWMLYAASRGGDLTIDINDGEYIFIYLSLT
jgi:hypothetical protein